MMYKNLKLFYLFLIVILTVQATAQEIQFGENEKDPITDGPYVFWKES